MGDDIMDQIMVLVDGDVDLEHVLIPRVIDAVNRLGWDGPRILQWCRLFKLRWDSEEYFRNGLKTEYLDAWAEPHGMGTGSRHKVWP